MAKLHQWDYLFVIGLLFASLDAYNIGANDVANSWATSVASKSLTLRQASFLAAIFEFLGAVLAGSHVTSTIKNGIIGLDAFNDNAGVQLLTFTCAITASASWLMIATRKSWPVSTTYSIISALAGAGVAVSGWDSVQWGWNNGKGLAAIFGGMAIAPALAGGFGAVVFGITKYAVLVRKNSIQKALYISPVYFFTIAVVLTMSIVYKGAPQLNLDDLPQVTIALAIVLTGLVIALLSILFWLPFVHAKVVKKDYTIRWYHFFYGPLLWRRAAPELPSGGGHVPDYRILTSESSETVVSPVYSGLSITEPDLESSLAISPQDTLDTVRPLDATHEAQGGQTKDLKSVPDIEGPWILPRNLWIIVRYRLPKILTHGTSIDIHALQTHGQDEAQQARLRKVHEQSTQYSNETEHLYSFLQVMTACTNSFAHGSNDTANAIGPFAVIYYVWSTGMATEKNTDTPVWQFALLGGILVIGLLTYGYNCMSVLGNRLTLLSPARGMSAELGSSITVLLASQYGIPVSTTMCIVGSTGGVGIMSGGLRAVNWRAFGWIYLGWIITVPVAAVLSGCLLGIILNAPHW
ncbi:sodium:inorganic phosphate symporter [Kockovaella imperatae]|uniref:Phosphate transporter n=1 Tax=Kockovaella imperatae TaxID=4999 RepID=A0A1Y1U824_9TREE|nr:sodium:inorganic phosphate symporter [Kockovaella imperatae]ORX34191.1 sodium:inorganic phosphate symporter [Kockovaella imperatae]